MLKTNDAGSSPARSPKIIIMEKTLTKVALRYGALFLGIAREDIDITSEVTVPASAFVARLNENGFCVSEELLHALYAVSADTLA